VENTLKDLANSKVGEGRGTVVHLRRCTLYSNKVLHGGGLGLKGVLQAICHAANKSSPKCCCLHQTC
jgi:hypothetical protein